MFRADNNSMVTKKGAVLLASLRNLYGGDTFTVLGCAHAHTPRTLFTLSRHGRHNLQMLSNTSSPGACVGQRFHYLALSLTLTPTITTNCGDDIP